MTTHFVEIRPSHKRRREARVSELHDLSTWEVLTVSAVSLADAENLRKVIGPHWESRVVPAKEIDQGELARLTLFGIVEELPNGRTVPRWKKVEVVHHPDCASPEGADVEWTTAVTSTMAATQWLALRAISENVNRAESRAKEIGIVPSPGLDHTVTQPSVVLSPPREHRGRCSECGGEARGLSVQVSLVSGCRHMVKEYAL